MLLVSFKYEHFLFFKYFLSHRVEFYGPLTGNRSRVSSITRVPVQSAKTKRHSLVRGKESGRVSEGVPHVDAALKPR